MSKVNKEKLTRITLLVLDVDGVLTDGKIIYSDSGDEIKAFNVRDGHGLKLLMRAGIEVIFLTGRESRVVLHRARDLGVESVYQKVLNKLEVYEKILKERGLTDEQIAFVGDDLVDIPVLRRVGFSAAVSDAIAEVKEIVDYVTDKKGGGGAVREICELLLKGQDKWEEVTQRYGISRRAASEA
jgi:3-deoxy-D-manno-octulosonate 8-phosphate phosphatase (KDO 8-P phosphatase)